MKIKQNSGFYLFITLLMVLFLMDSCSAPIQLATQTGAETSIVRKKDIFILPAVIKYESIENETELPDSMFQGKEVREFLLSKSANILAIKGFNVQMEDSSMFMTSPKIKETYYRILDDRKKLFRKSFSPDLINDLKLLNRPLKEANLLVVMLRVKVGDGGSWDPYSGAITSGSGYSRIKAVVIDLENANSLWQGGVQFQGIPSVKNSKLVASINFLYQNLKTKKE